MRRERTRPYPPLTSETQLIRTVKEQNALNKQRAKAMERRIAKKLRGRRVPMSGAAAQYKGDVEIPFVAHPGHYIIECKLTAQKHDNDPVMRLDFKWFPKIHLEAKNMGAKFGVVIINYLHSRNDFVFVRMDIVRLLMDRYRSKYADVLLYLSSYSNILEVRYTPTGKPKGSHMLIKDTLESALLDHNGMKGVRIMLPDAEYLVLTLDTFDAIMDEI